MKKLFSVLILSTVFLLVSCNGGTPITSKQDDNTDVKAQAAESSKETEIPDSSEIFVMPEKAENKTAEKNESQKNETATSKSEKSNPTTNTQKVQSEPTTSVQTPSALTNGLDRTKHGFGYTPNSENKQVSIGQKYEDMMTEYGAFFIDRSNTPNIYLTMDEGYENGYTPVILDTLREKGVVCTFFITKPYLDKNSELVKRMIDEGHTVGNHSVNHKSMPTLTDDEAQKEILDLHNDVFVRFGYTMEYFRPPMGEYSQASLCTAQSLGYRSVFWSFAYRDWETNNQKGKDYAVKSVENGIHNGCILLLHAVSKDNAEGLGEIIDNLRAKGYIFSSLDSIP